MNARENQTAEWKNIREISKSGRSIMFTAFLVKLLPHHLLIALTRFVTFFYYIPAKEARKVSRDYQNKLITFAKNLPSRFSAPAFNFFYKTGRKGNYMAEGMRCFWNF